jgi:hypothetical protein
MHHVAAGDEGDRLAQLGRHRVEPPKVADVLVPVADAELVPRARLETGEFGAAQLQRRGADG